MRFAVLCPAVLASALVLGACTESQSTQTSASSTTAAPEDEAATVRAELKDAQGKEIGTVTFTEKDGSVDIDVEAHDLTPGFHGFHIHQVGKCEPNSEAPTGGKVGNFLSAGPHFQVSGHDGHPASGDLTSLQVLADGTANLHTTTDAFTITDLTSDGGRAAMVHAGADNFGNIPTRYQLPDGAAVPDDETMKTGDAGGRVACGVIS